MGFLRASQTPIYYNNPGCHACSIGCQPVQKTVRNLTGYATKPCGSSTFSMKEGPLYAGNPVRSNLR